jgi:hypothetical protein
MKDEDTSNYDAIHFCKAWDKTGKLQYPDSATALRIYQSKKRNVRDENRNEISWTH